MTRPAKEANLSSTITLSQQVYDELVQRAHQTRQSPDALAEDLLRHSLGTETEQWRQAFEALIQKVHARTNQFTSEEIEADITAAAEEVRESRRVRHRRR